MQPPSQSRPVESRLKRRERNDKFWIRPGRWCKCRYNMEAPPMKVVHMDNRSGTNPDGSTRHYTLSIRCRWTDADGRLHYAEFSVSDLVQHHLDGKSRIPAEGDR